MKIKEKLEAIVGKEFMYHGKNVKIDNYKFVNGRHVVFMPTPKPFFDDEAEDFLDDLYPSQEKDLKPTQMAIPETKLRIYEPTAENTSVKATLLDTLERIKNDKEYINQAQAICNVVSQMVNVQKVEIQMLQILNSKK